MKAARVSLVLAGVLAGAVMAYPVGVRVGRMRTEAAQMRSPGGLASRRNHYSPRILSDPNFIEQLRPVAEALAAECRRSRTHCTEAEAARRRLNEMTYGR